MVVCRSWNDDTETIKKVSEDLVNRILCGNADSDTI